MTVSCTKKLRLHNGSQSQRPRSTKIPVPRRDREVNFIFTIHEKKRALVNMRSLLLEPSVQRVYQVIFANTLQDMTARLARKPPWRTASGSKWPQGTRSTQ
jgi:hypothetical protein